MLESEERVELVSLDQIIPLPGNVTVIGREEDLMLRTDMTRLETRGRRKIDPILLRRLTQEEIAEIKAKQPWSQASYQILDGHSRWRAARELGWTRIRAIIIDATLEEAYAINYMKNKARGTIDPLREAVYFKHLYEDLKLTQDKIAEKFGLTRVRVSQILSRTGITLEARSIVSRLTMEPLSGAHLEVIASAPPEKQPELAKVIVEERLSKREAVLVGKALEKGLPTGRAVSVVKAVKKVAKPKQAEKLLHHISSKPDVAEEITRLPEERLKAKVEEILKPHQPPLKKEFALEEFKPHYPAIMIDYIYTRYKGEHFKDVVKAAIWIAWWEKLTEKDREEIVKKAIQMASVKGFEEPTVG